MTAPLVSVVVPVFNGAKYLRAALDSALGQTYSALEIVAVDDGSTDASPEILASYGSRLTVIRQKNSGVAAARNASIQASCGKFIAFLDQDDWWLSEKIEKQVALFQKDSRLGLVHTGILQYSEGAAGFVDPVYPTHLSPQLQGRCYQQLLLENAVYNSSVMIRRAALADSGLFNTDMAGNTVQDYDLWLRLAQHYPFGYIAEPLTVLRLHGEQGTWDRRAMLVDELRLLERTVRPRDIYDSTPLRTRFARLLDELGVAHLDACSPRLARSCFARALRMRWSSRVALLFTASFLPSATIGWLRCQRARWRKSVTGAMGKPVSRHGDKWVEITSVR
ncbi:MAG TPA: glycosyltransferase family A protein [Gemmataceae bacterium]|nr:glycosyltransferase family A protein [Gemmataceae bacterium]